MLAKPACCLALSCLFADDLLERQPASVQLGLDRREPSQGGLAQPVALYLPGHRRRRLLYGAYGALQEQEISLVHGAILLPEPSSRIRSYLRYGASPGDCVLSAIGQDLLERRLVAFDHRLDAETLVYVLPAAVGIYVLQTTALDRRNHLVPLTLTDQNTYLTVLDDLRCGAQGVRHDRRAAGQSFGHHQSERFFPLDGEEQKSRPGEQLLLALTSHLALVDDVLSVEVGLDALLEVVGVHSRIYLAGHAQRDARLLGYVYGVVCPFVLAEASQEERVVFLLGPERVRFDLDGVVDRAHVVQLRAPGALRVGDGVEVDPIGDHAAQPLNVWIERPVQSVQYRSVRQSSQTRRHRTGMIVDDVVLIGLQESGHDLYGHGMHRVVEVLAAKAHGIIEGSVQAGLCARVSRSIEGDVVPPIDELVGEQADYPLYPSIALGRHPDPGWRNLRYSHESPLRSTSTTRARTRPNGFSSGRHLGGAVGSGDPQLRSAPQYREAQRLPVLRNVRFEAGSFVLDEHAPETEDEGVPHAAQSRDVHAASGRHPMGEVQVEVGGPLEVPFGGLEIAGARGCQRVETGAQRAVVRGSRLVEAEVGLVYLARVLVAEQEEQHYHVGLLDDL